MMRTGLRCQVHGNIFIRTKFTAGLGLQFRAYRQARWVEEFGVFLSSLRGLPGMGFGKSWHKRKLIIWILRDTLGYKSVWR